MIAPTRIETAAAIGVHLDAELGELSIVGRALRIGTIVIQDDGEIHAVPRRGIGAYTAELLAVAEDVAVAGRDRSVMGRDRSAAWGYQADLGWYAGVVVPLHRRSEIAEEVRG
ncbi:hypothetical protein [Nocardia fusca]|uniref:hypothetical protein n=1 Tax=Nocardia fusca TaxID=941183 RepID=UPI0007A73442|nr:hypothetical protein [Nocardia fusca]